MSDFQSLDDELTQALVDSIHEIANYPGRVSLDPQMVDDLIALVNAIPYYFAPEWETAHKGTLGTLAAIHSGTAEIEVPIKGGKWQVELRSSYTDYKTAFYHGVNGNAATDRVKELASAEKEYLSESWWGNYNVPLLTDTIRKATSVYIDTSSLENDLSAYHNEIVPALSATYQGVFELGYGPTATPFDALKISGMVNEAALLLDEAITNGLFTNNVNAVMNTPPDGPTAATWFLFNLWISLKALGYADVDAAIARYQSEEVGLNILPVIGPYSWWQGEYTTWYTPLSGNDVVPPATETANATLPCWVWSNGPYPSFVISYDGIPYGYGISYCELGDFNRYFDGTNRKWYWE